MTDAVIPIYAQTCSICCGVVQQAVQQIHNILTCQDVVDLLYNNSATNRTSGVWVIRASDAVEGGEF